MLRCSAVHTWSERNGQCAPLHLHDDDDEDERRTQVQRWVAERVGTATHPGPADRPRQLSCALLLLWRSAPYATPSVWTSWDAATDRQDAADRRSGQSAGDFPRCGRRYDAPESVRGGLGYRVRALGRDDVDRLAACSRAVFLWGIPTDLVPMRRLLYSVPRALRIRGLASSSSDGLHTTRNVGIIAHIDAGKTTTTERMLLLAGVTRAAGSVDSGDTVMDHMDQERERGITIQAAATRFHWANGTTPYAIHLIDTPGHVDFTIEVERTMRVLDGAVLIVDAVAGAQAQTEAVWRQARHHGVPAVAFINKMDREGARFDSALQSLEQRLSITPLPVQHPWPSSETNLGGAIDLIEMVAFGYTASGATQGGRAQRGAALEIVRVPLSAEGEPSGVEALSVPSAVCEAAVAARLDLVERVADLDPDGELASLYLEELPVDAQTLREAVRRLTLEGRGVPALCGASLHGIGVEPLLDAICHYLPSPLDRSLPGLTAIALDGSVAEAGGGGGGGGSNRVHGGQQPGRPVELALDEAGAAVAFAFKVVHDPRSKKPIVWLRTYSGEMAPGQPLLNGRLGEEERPTRLLVMHGDETSDVQTVGAGAICAAVGMKRTRTGDTLLLHPRPGHAELQLPVLRTPTPVFFTAVEVASASQQPALDAALGALTLEDPSVSVRVDPVTGQQLLGGMGELHLQVVAERLRREYRLELYTGAMQVAYREGISEAYTLESSHAAMPGGADEIHIRLALRPSASAEWAAEREAGDGGAGGGGAGASDDGSLQCSATRGVREALTRRELQAVLDGLNAGSQYGPLQGYPLYGLRATLLSVQRPKGTSPDALRKACSEALPAAVERASPALLEPLMVVELRAPEKHIGAVLKELTGKRRGDVLQVVAPDGAGAADDRHLVQAEVPLSALVGYANALRSLTQGEAALSMEFARYRPGGGDESTHEGDAVI